MEYFVIIVHDFQPLTIITKHSILDVAGALDPPLVSVNAKSKCKWKEQLLWGFFRFFDVLHVMFTHLVILFFYYKMCKYTNALMKIWKSHLKIDTLIHLKIIYWKCRILNRDKSRIIYPQSLHLFWKIRLIFNIFYCFRMFVNKIFTYLRHVCFKRWKVLWYDFQIYISVALS